MLIVSRNISCQNLSYIIVLRALIESVLQACATLGAEWSRLTGGYFQHETNELP